TLQKSRVNGSFSVCQKIEQSGPGGPGRRRPASAARPCAARAPLCRGAACQRTYGLESAGRRAKGAYSAGAWQRQQGAYRALRGKGAGSFGKVLAREGAASETTQRDASPG